MIISVYSSFTSDHGCLVFVNKKLQSLNQSWSHSSHSAIVRLVALHLSSNVNFCWVAMTHLLISSAVRQSPSPNDPPVHLETQLQKFTETLCLISLADFLPTTSYRIICWGKSCQSSQPGTKTSKAEIGPSKLID